ncbi:MAG: hypothetical protein LBN41_08990 [Enterobacteriaceae bacterium]|jgi:hypothetical protein|nr:hypothetical protein [Enterobacteriaceae bacterium]
MATNSRLIPASQWVVPTLTVAENDQLLTFSVQSAFNYHGYDAVGGVVLGFRLLQRALALLSENNEPLQRRELTLFTAFPGLGARDCFELVSRMVTEQRFTLDTDFIHPDAQKGIAGSFYFEFGYRGKRVALAPIVGQPSSAFLAAGRASKQPDATAEIQQQWIAAKYQLANTLLGISAQDAIRVL